MANEKRLIDANTLLEKILSLTLTVTGLRAGKGVLLELLNKYRNGILQLVNEQPTVDAVEVADMREFAEDVVYQFGYYCQNGGRLHITHGGLSTLEWAFDILGWENPHPVPECECEIEFCHEHATCGTPTADGYKRVCGKHFAKMDGDGNG